MSEEIIEKSKLAVEAADHISPEKKAELLDALSKIKPAIAEASQVHSEHAQNIAKLVEASAHTAARKEERPEHLKKLLQELRQSAQNFEASHPHLVAAVNEYSTVLSALGI
jgi:ABC-type transporter Mla subunit MlaD